MTDRPGAHQVAPSMGLHDKWPNKISQLSMWVPSQECKTLRGLKEHYKLWWRKKTRMRFQKIQKENKDGWAKRIWKRKNWRWRNSNPSKALDLWGDGRWKETNKKLKKKRMGFSFHSYKPDERFRWDGCKSQETWEKTK